MKRLIVDLPRPVAIALATIVAAIAVLAILFPVLGGARDNALTENRRLTTDIGSTTTALNQSQDDQDFVRANQAHFEELVKSDRLIPHTRRAAIVALGEVARIHGVNLTYAFNAAESQSAAAVGSQPRSDAYRVSVESIDLKVDAPIDGAIYEFVTDINASFPGAVVIESVSLRRADRLSASALDLLSKGQSSQLVTGDILLSWRTAQAQEKKEAGKAAK
jgi:hypothetical protein